MSELASKIRRKWTKLRLQPIRVYCLHHVCAEFNAESMNAGDWMQIDEFKTKVMAMQQNGVEFISLTEAYDKIANDKFRNHKYVVFTFDDGNASLKEILPWLEEQKIPTTLFINGKYLDGKSYRKNPKEKYLTYEELFAMTSPLVEIGSHGWEHIRATEQTRDEFEKSVMQNMILLNTHPRHVYTYGDHNAALDAILQKSYILPVLIDGLNNYNDTQIIHRELLK